MIASRRAVVLFALPLLTACALRGGSVSPDASVEEGEPRSTPPETPSEQGEVVDPSSLSLEEQVELLFGPLGLEKALRANQRAVADLYRVIVQILPEETNAAREAVAASLDELVESPDLLIPAREHLISHAPEDDLAAVLLWRSSEVGEGWTAATGSGPSSEKHDPDEIMSWLDAFYDGLHEDPDLQERLELVEAIEAAGQLGRRSMDFTLRMGSVLLDDLATSLPEPMRPRPEHVSIMRSTMEASMAEPALEEIMLKSQLYATRELSLEELRVVRSYYEDGPGSRFLDVLDGATLEAGRALSEALARALGRAWEDEPPAGS